MDYPLGLRSQGPEFKSPSGRSLLAVAAFAATASSFGPDVPHARFARVGLRQDALGFIIKRGRARGERDPKGNVEYARERGGLDSTEPFDAETAGTFLRNEASKLAPESELQCIFVDRYAPGGTIAGRLRKFARQHDGTISTTSVVRASTPDPNGFQSVGKLSV